MHYVIDGYNLLFRLLVPDNNIEAYRESLIKILLKQSEEKKISMTVVFDAHHQKAEGYRTHKGRLEIVYTDFGQTADAYILSRLAPNCTIVTSDDHLARHVRNSGYPTLSIDKFIKLIRPTKANILEKPTLYLHDKLFEYYLNAFESNNDD
jgi:predicted RNA-binding protein with PIN domain